MPKLFPIENKLFFLIEVAFLLFLSFGVSLMSDIEYSAYEKHDISHFSDDFGYRIVTDSLAFIEYAIFYWCFLKKYVFEKKRLGIFLSILIFLFLDKLYGKYVVNWFVANSSIVSDSLRKRSFREFHDPKIYFVVNYIIVSRILPLLGLTFLIRTLQQERQMKTLREQQLLSELNYLKAQIQPHFFFNTFVCRQIKLH